MQWWFKYSSIIFDPIYVISSKWVASCYLY